MHSFEWPNGFKAAACFTWDLDGESAAYFRNPDQARNQCGELVQRSYGPEVGVWKTLDLMNEYDIKATYFVPGYTANTHPDAVEGILKGGHSIGLHGYMHETMDLLSEKQESDMFDKSIRSLEKLTGYKPDIFRSPSFELNRRTPSLLIKNGVRSDSSLMGDDYPYVIDTEGGPLIEIPVNWIMDDFEFWGHTKSNRQKSISDPDTVLKLWKREFEGLYKAGGIFVLTMHPFVTGRWVYLDTVRKLIEYIMDFPGTWITSVKDITDHCTTHMEDPFMVHRKLPSPEIIEFS